MEDLEAQNNLLNEQLQEAKEKHLDITQVLKSSISVAERIESSFVEVGRGNVQGKID